MAGFVGGLAGLALLLIAVLRSHWRNAKLMVAGVVLVGLVFVALNQYSDGLLIRRLALEQLTRLFKVTQPQIQFNGVRIDSLKAEILYTTAPITIELKGNQLYVYDSDGNQLELKYNQNSKEFIPVDKQYRMYRIQPGKNLVLVRRGANKFYFSVKDNQFVLLDNKKRIIDVDAEVASWGFEGKEDFASKRGYIWSRSLPLLRQTLFLGFGPDTYAIYFPQHDYIGTNNFMGNNMHILVDKPHNLYLQTAINTGVLSLIALLVLFGMYAWHSFRLYIVQKHTGFYAAVGLGCFAAVISYLVAGLANDSVVSVAPVFWVILGLGISCNYFLGHTSKKA